MINKCNDVSQIKQIYNYIAGDEINAPYLFNNLEVYGIDNENVDIWIDSDESGINAVYLKYFTCLHIYSRNESVAEFVKAGFDGKLGFVPKIVMIVTKHEDLSESITDKRYKLEVEHIYVKNTNDIVSSDYTVSEAKKDELILIAQLMMNDSLYQEIYSSVEAVHEQLTERYMTGYGKCFIVKENDRIVASCAINAINSRFGIVGSIIVDPEYRRKGLAQVVCSHAWQSIIDNSDRYIIDMVAVDNTASKNFHAVNGFEKVGNIYKFKSSERDR